MRTWRLLFAVGLLAALVVPASSASAKPHTTVGTPETECAVNGFVELSEHDDNDDGGLDNNKSEGHYKFVSTTLSCIGKKGGDYNVEAEGDTTDLWHGNEKKDPTNNENGEDCEQGGSAKKDKDGDPNTGVNGEEELHSGVLEAQGKSGQGNLVGEVHFARLGTTVLADGPLWKGTEKGDQNDPDQFFQAELEFVPTEGDCTDKENPVTEASLTGIAEIYNDWVTHDCTEEELQKQVDDPHCDTV